MQKKEDCKTRGGYNTGVALTMRTPDILESAVIKTTEVTPAPAAESNKTLLIGGVILAAVVVYFLTKKSD